MKFILNLLLIPVLFWLSITCLNANTKHTRTKIFNQPIYMQNTAESPIPVFSSVRPKYKALGTLKPGATLRFQYAGTSGKWWYGLGNMGGKRYKVLIKSPHKRKVIKVADITISLPYLANLTLILFLLSLLSFLLMVLISIFRWLKGKIQQHKNKKLAQLREQDQQREAIHLLTQQKRQLEAQLHSQKQASHTREVLHKQQRQELTNQNLKLARENKKLQQSQVSSNHLQQQFEQREQQLRDHFKQESVRRTEVKLEQMQSSYQKLNNEYQGLQQLHQKHLREGIKFDVDFKGDNYEKLLKGREFEIYLARLLQNAGFKLLQWTSDKGFENDIRVEANGDPDFIIGYQDKFKFAVECKYRSTTFNDKQQGKLINWSKYSQMKRYKQYQQDTGLPVFVALGRFGQASAPESTYFIALDQLVNKGESRKILQQWQCLIDESKLKAKKLTPSNVRQIVLNSLEANTQAIDA